MILCSRDSDKSFHFSSPPKGQLYNNQDENGFVKKIKYNKETNDNDQYADGKNGSNHGFNIIGKGYKNTNTSITFDKSTLLSVSGLHQTKDIIEEYLPNLLDVISKTFSVVSLANGKNDADTAKTDIHFMNNSSVISLRANEDKKPEDNNKNITKPKKRKSKLDKLSKIIQLLNDQDSDSSFESDNSSI
ncbi:hypothetical protein WA158_003266 [Blastocystis sp. Blastoise]